MDYEKIKAREYEFFDFVYNRQMIWYKRFVLKEKPPWARDSILQKYKIINVYRELDKGTLYILEKLKHIKDRKTVFLNVVFYRFFNKFNLYESLGIPPFNHFDKEVKDDLIIKFKQSKIRGKPIFNDAYLIAGKKGEEKYISVLNSLSWLWENLDSLIKKIDEAKTSEESLRIIKEIPLVGNFLAYEIWTDLTYFRFFKNGWTDDDFVNIGPGAKWGLEIIYGKSSMDNLKKLYKIQKEFLGKKKNPSWEKISYKGAFSSKPFLSLGNIENALCEFRKYYNLSRGKGKRRKFKTLSKIY